MRAPPPRELAFALGGGGFVIAASSAAVSLGARSLTTTSYGTSSPGLAVLASVTGAALFAAAALLAVEGTRPRAALATFCLGCAWSADVWAGWSAAPTLLRTSAMLLVPMLAPFGLLTVASVLPRTRPAYAGVTVSAAGIAAGLALWLVRDPFLDRYCWRDCLAHSLAPFSGAELARTATNVSLALGAACGALVVALCAVGLARRTLVWVVLAGVAWGCALATSEIVLRLEPAEDPTRPLYASLFAARGIALLALAVSLGYLALRPRLVRRAISRLAVDPERSAGGGLGTALAAAIGDAELRIGYPLPGDGPTVDAEGRPMTFERAAAKIVRGGELVALIGSAAGTPAPAALERALGPAARLALANERLRAEQLFRLHELTELRRRIVATGDAARRRLERDLHDGAQQRLLALAIDLRIALKRAEAAGRAEAARLLREAAERVGEATVELRGVAHGIFPTTLANAGLAAALDTLADERRLVLSIELDAGRRFPPELETAAYAIVAEGTSSAPDTVRVRVEERRGALLLTLDGAAWDGVSSAEERVGAAGGTVQRTGRRLRAVLPVPPPVERR
jgi:signal transduction histidine kinase